MRPVHQNRHVTSLKICHPISFLSNFVKVFEIGLYNRLLPLVRHTSPTSQQTFVPARSTVINLASLSRHVSKAIDGRGQVDIIIDPFL